MDLGLLIRAPLSCTPCGQSNEHWKIADEGSRFKFEMQMPSSSLDLDSECTLCLNVTHPHPGYQTILLNKGTPPVSIPGGCCHGTQTPTAQPTCGSLATMAPPDTRILLAEAGGGGRERKQECRPPPEYVCAADVPTVLGWSSAASESG